MAAQHPRPTLHAKFRAGVAEEQRRAVLADAAKLGVTGSRPLFPGSSEPELSLIIVLECADEAAAERARRALAARREIEYVERPPTRKLVR